jgi:hypothetical protein
MSLFATAEQIKKAMTLDVDDIRAALERQGYATSKGEILGAGFKGYNGESFVYEITFPDPEEIGVTATGRVFVQVKKPAFESEFNFYADY